MSLRDQAGCAVALSVVVVLAAALTADGQVPTVADFAACNDEAPQTVKGGTVSPTPSDRVRADNARAAAAVTTKSGEGAATLIQSSDPQIHGMSAEGAKDAVYQAAYRSCMRRKGF